MQTKRRHSDGSKSLLGYLRYRIDDVVGSYLTSSCFIFNFIDAFYGTSGALVNEMTCAGSAFVSKRCLEECAGDFFAVENAWVVLKGVEIKLIVQEVVGQAGSS